MSIIGDEDHILRFGIATASFPTTTIFRDYPKPKDKDMLEYRGNAVGLISTGANS